MIVSRLAVIPAISGGRDLWTSLSLSFIDFQDLLLFLKRGEFSGYAQVSYADVEGLVFFQEGDVVLGLKQSRANWKAGRAEAEEILGRAGRDKSGEIHVVSVPGIMVGLIARVFSAQTKVVHANLSSEFTHLGKFIARMKTEKFNGYLEMRPQKKASGPLEIMLFEKGTLSGIITRPFQAIFDENNPAHIKELKAYVDNAQAEGMIFNAYQFL